MREIAGLFLLGCAALVLAVGLPFAYVAEFAVDVSLRLEGASDRIRGQR